MGYIEQYSEMLRRKNKQFELVDCQIFIREDRWIKPVGPMSQAFQLREEQCRELLRTLGGIWVMWTDGFRPHAAGSEWYAVICRKYIPVEEIASANLRKHIRRGLKRCEVRQVDAREIAQNGYETYCAAIQGYGDRTHLPTKEEFARRVMTDESFGDTRHQWAAYHDGQLIAFNQNLIFDNIEVDYSLGKYHPDYLKHYPAYALFNQMNEYYLVQKGFQYINAGTRSISHETEIQDFLLKKFGFEKAYTNLHVHYRPPLGLLLKMAKPFRRILTMAYPKVNALFELDRLRAKGGDSL